jgi:hypothetical protein
MLANIYLQNTSTLDGTTGILLFNNSAADHKPLHSLNLRKSAIGSINPQDWETDADKEAARNAAIMDFANVVFELREDGQ